MLELNKVYCMDALDLLRQLDTESVDAIIADPPYGLTELDFDQQPSSLRRTNDPPRRVARVAHQRYTPRIEQIAPCAQTSGAFTHNRASRSHNYGFLHCS